MLRTVKATRYVLPLREGGSLPAIVEADDLGLYVLKFRGAGQGLLALVAELVAGEIGRALGLEIPQIVFAEVDPILGRSEPDAEIRHLLKASAGLNLALDYLPGSVMFDAAAGDTVTPEVASMAVWFDAFVQNVDRTARNANLLMWHRKPYFIDHGAALFFHHNWPTAGEKAASSFPQTQDHLLLRWASKVPEAAAIAHARLQPKMLSEILNLVPDAWLGPEPVSPIDPLESESTSPEGLRLAYFEYLTSRLAASAKFEEEAIRAHQRLI